MRRRARSERGAVLVEMALVAPLLIMMLFGTAEYSMAWRSSNHTAKILRNALLEQQRNPTALQADYNTIDTLREVVGTKGLDTISWVIVYEAPIGNSSPPTACVVKANNLTSGVDGIPGTCNIYSWAFMKTATASQFSNPACPSPQPDRYWCPSTRYSTFSTTDRIGVAIRWGHRWVTRIIPSNGVTSTDFAVALPAPNPKAP